MAKFLTEEEFDEYIKESGSQYFIQQEEHGAKVVIMKSEIARVDPGDEDLVGRVWAPKGDTEWSKHEAEVEIDGLPYIYSFGGRRSGVLREFLKQCRLNNISASEIPGTKWRIQRVGNK